jgi:hypothetical protein
VNITPTHRRVVFVTLVAMAAFGGGGLVGSATAEPEVVTVSRNVPGACTEAIDAGFDGLAAQSKADKYRDKASALAADLTLATLAVDAAGIEDALTPMAKQNALEDEWRVNQEEARGVFIDAANQCLALDTAAEAARDR